MNSVVSIVIPCYNQSQYLSEAVQSVLSQTYAQWECIIVDDGSTDDTSRVAGSLCRLDNRIRFVAQPNSGLSAARNTGISLAKGVYILPLDADDAIRPTYLAQAVNKFIEDPGLTLVYCQAEYFGAQSGLWPLPVFSLEQLAVRNLIFCSSVFRKSSWEEVGGYKTNMRFGLEDWDFNIALLKGGGRVHQLPEVLFSYRVKEDSMLTGLSRNEVQNQRMFMQVYLHHADFFDRFHKEPIDVFSGVRYLKDHVAVLEQENKHLKDLLKLRLSAIRTAFRKRLLR